MNTTETPAPAENTPSVAPLPHTPSNDLTGTLSQSAAIRELLRDGYTVAEAGQRLGISRSTAFRRLALIEEDIDRGVVNFLTAKKLELAEHWLKAASVGADKGDHRPAKDALLHARAIEPVTDSNGQNGTRIAIIIGTPEQPICVSSPQVLDAQIVTADKA